MVPRKSKKVVPKKAALEAEPVAAATLARKKCAVRGIPKAQERTAVARAERRKFGKPRRG
jgi:hypothetical protein